MQFDPKFMDVEATKGIYGDSINAIENPSGGHHMHSVDPVPFIATDGREYMLLPDGKVEPLN